MADKKSKENKGAIIGICCAIVVVIVIVIVAVVLATTGGNRLGDDYFKSDDTKYVLTIETDKSVLEEEGGEYTPVKTHLVYTYEGDTVTGLKTYGEYKDAATAKAAFDMMAESNEDMNGAVVEGKYIIVTAPAEQYEGLTASDVKKQLEFMEQLKNMNLSEGSTGSTESEVVESTTEGNTTGEQE